MNSQHPCNECVHFVGANWWKQFRQGMFAEGCAHPDHRDEIDGSPKPCVTMRIMDCDGRVGEYSPHKFRPKHSSATPTQTGE